MNHWFRVYNSMVDDPKVQTLPDALFRSLVNLWCVASQNDGVLPAAADVAFKLRISTAKAAEIITKLFQAGLLDKMEGGGFAPHNWKSRQYISDNSTTRVQRYREKRAAKGLPVTWTAPKKLRGEVYARDNHQCVYCESAVDLSIDHKTPQSRGGSDDLDNLQTLCRPCNASKRDMTHEEFVSRNGNETFRKRSIEEQTTEQSTAQHNARAVISGSEKALRSDLAEVFGAAKCPADLSRAGVWLSKGYSPSMIVEIVRELLARKPDVASLAYFDSALAERHGKRAMMPSERAAAATSIDFDKVVSMFARTGLWSKYAGPEPGQIGCRVSAEMLERHGIAPDGQKIRKVG